MVFIINIAFYRLLSCFQNSASSLSTQAHYADVSLTPFHRHMHHYIESASVLRYFNVMNRSGDLTVIESPIAAITFTSIGVSL